MSFAVVLPKVGMTMVEATIVTWHAADKATVQQGDALFSFETEKVNYDVEAEAAGTLRIIHPVDAVVPVAEVVAYILAEGEDLPAGVAPVPVAPAAASNAAATAPAPAAASAISAAPAAPRAGGVKASPAARRLAEERGIDISMIAGTGPGGRVLKDDIESAPAPQAAPASAGGRVKASPAARARATEIGIDLASVPGSGPGGRIVKDDVDAAADAAAAAPALVTPLPPLSGEVPYRGIRRTVGERMLSSIQEMAQLTIVSEVDVTEAVKLRGQLVEDWEADGVRVTYTDFVIKAAALALRRHPRVNATLDGDTVRVQPQVHVGFAVALDEGLIVPVLRDADAMELKALARRSAELALAAREGGLGPDDLTGGTFNVTSLGMFGVDAFTPIINPPQAAILGVGRIVERPGFMGSTGTDIQRRAYLTLSLTIDHRVLDGAPAAQYLQTVAAYLERPYRLFSGG